MKDRIDNCIQHVRRRYREKGDVYLFWIGGKFVYTDDSQFDYYYRNHESRFIGTYDDAIKFEDIRDDILTFFEELKQ